MDRMIRQAQLINPAMQESTVVLVGAGMLGGWLANSLARTCGHLHVFDFDIVDDVNIGTQPYSTSDLGVPKVIALADHLRGLPLTAWNTRFEPDQDTRAIDNDSALVVVSAVDSFSGRALVAQWAIDHDADLFVDLRAAGTVGVLVVLPNDGFSIQCYISTLETDADAPVAACGAEGTALVGMYLAALATGSINRFYSGLPTPAKVVHDVNMDLRLLSQSLPEFAEVGAAMV